MSAPPRTPSPRVLHILPSDVGGGAQVAARALRDRLDGPDRSHRTLAIFDLSQGVLAPDYELLCRSGRLRRMGYDPRVARRLKTKLEELAPGVVVAHGAEPLQYCVSAKPRGSRLIYHQIASTDDVLKTRLHTARHRRLVRAADQVVAISEELAAEAMTHFDLDPAKVVVIPNGRDPAHYRCADHRQSPVGLIYQAQMTAPKRPLWFVEVVRRLVDQGHHVEGTMVGDGPLLPQVCQAVGDLPVDVLGRCAPTEIPKRLAAAQILVFPGEPSGEGMPGAFVEAGLAGLPVVTTHVPGATTVVRHGTTGWIAPAHDLDRLVAHTAALVADPPQRAEMGMAARDRCLQHFTVDVTANVWSQLIRNVAG